MPRPRVETDTTDNQEITQTPNVPTTREAPSPSGPHRVVAGLLLVLLLVALAYIGYSEWSHRQTVKELAITTQKLQELERRSQVSGESVAEKIVKKVEEHIVSPVSSPPAEMSSNTYATARDAYQTALSAARAQDADAQLVGVTGIEAQRPDQFVEVYRRVDHPEVATMQPEMAANPTDLHNVAIIFFSVPSADQAIGDGKASAWLFSFVGPKGTRVVAVKGGSEVTFNRAVPNDAAAPAGRRLTDIEAAWQLDSDLMARAAEAIPNFADVRRQSSLAVHVLSMKEGQDPYWNTSLLVGDIGDRDWEWSDILVSMTGTVTSRGQLCGRTKESCQR